MSVISIEVVAQRELGNPIAKEDKRQHMVSGHQIIGRLSSTRRMLTANYPYTSRANKVENSLTSTSDVWIPHWNALDLPCDMAVDGWWM